MKNKVLSYAMWFTDPRRVAIVVTLFALIIALVWTIGVAPGGVAFAGNGTSGGP